MEDFLEPEVAIAAAVAAAIFSPRVRGVLRRGAVFGVAGALMASDALSAFARGMGRGVQQARVSAAATPHDDLPRTSPAATPHDDEERRPKKTGSRRGVDRGGE
jgi:hypothetical protein